MSTVKDKAEEQASKHASKFWDDNSWDDILEKYAEVSNRYRDEINRLVERQERGARIEAEDKADMYYYGEYQKIFAYWIANNTLTSKGYERNKNTLWILKKQPPAPPKKKFGFWG